MIAAVFDQTTIDIRAAVSCSATGSVLKFDGFLKVYEEAAETKRAEEKNDEEEERNLPAVREGEN
ncbi:MAG: hypothetical protein IPM25_03435 [Chloracidobacterium sp.]|nr:hypothetical protein [Chloracidobacterium sp.]